MFLKFATKVRIYRLQIYILVRNLYLQYFNKILQFITIL